jgi:transposase
VKKHAAEILGISLKTLYNRLEDYAAKGELPNGCGHHVAATPARRQRRDGAVRRAADACCVARRTAWRCQHGSCVLNENDGPI